MNRLRHALILLVFAATACPRPAAAQADRYPFHVGVQLAGAVSGEFDATDWGIGGRVAWQPAALLGLEAELTFFPGDFDNRLAFSASRVEGVFGATVGPQLGRLRPFAKLRPGFVTFGEAPDPIACILIFPPPLRCTLAAGRTMFALDVGGGVEWLATDRLFVRVDAGDRMVRYPSPVIDSEGTVRDESFSGHDFRFGLGAGVRF
jgi:hypothetical protein